MTGRPSYEPRRWDSFLQQTSGGSTGAESMPACRLRNRFSRANKVMVAPFQGGCACKAVRYEVSSEPFAVMECHCRDCQHSSGGAATVAVVLPKPAFALTKGTPKGYTVTGDNGGAVTRFFCGECGSPPFRPPHHPPIPAVEDGTPDDPPWAP